MKKGLIGIVVVSFVALICGSAFALTFDEVDINATMEWTVFNEDGFMGGSSFDPPALDLVDLEVSSGPWSAGTDDGAWDYLEYASEMATVGLHASVGYDIYDLGHGISEAQGLTVEADFAPFSVDIAYNADEAYGVGGEYDLGLMTVGAKYNSTEAMGVELGFPLKAVEDMTLYLQYARGEVLGATTAYAFTGEWAPAWANATDDSEVTWGYTVSDFPFPSFESIKIEVGVEDYPVTASTLVAASVSSVETGGVSTTSYSGSTATTLVDGVTFTLEVGKVGDADLTYSGVIGFDL